MLVSYTSYIYTRNIPIVIKASDFSSQITHVVFLIYIDHLKFN